MRICICGAGAGGGHLAVRLARAGHDVSVIARGAHLAAIRADGLRLRAGEIVHHARVRAADDPAGLGAQDLVIVAVKATGLGPVAERLSPLVADHTLVLFPQNGMTWWYPVGLPPDRPAPPRLPIFRLAEAFFRTMRPEQVLAGVIYSANEIEAPGIVRNNSPAHNRLDIAAIDGRADDAVRSVRAVIEEAGLISTPPGDIREAVWTKLLANMSGSVIALIMASASAICRSDPGLGEIYRRTVREGLTIAAAHGYPLDHKVDPDRMLERLVDHKPSLRQDYEQHRPMEIGEIVLAPLAFARSQRIATPTLDVLAALASKLALDRGLISGSAIAELQLWPDGNPASSR